MPVFRAGAGSRPASDSLSFASPKESKQRKGDPQSATPTRCVGADLRRGGCGVRRGTRFAASQLRSDSRGESVHEAAAHLRDCHPATAPAQAQPEGVGCRTAEQPNSRTATRVVAALDPGSGCARRQRRRPARGACAREVGPSEAKARMDVRSHPLCMRRGAQRVGWRVCRRTHALRELTRRSCLSGARRAQRVLRRTPPASTTGCPERSAGTQTAGSPFLW